MPAPTSQVTPIPQSSFFSKNRSLPTTAQIKAINQKIGGYDALDHYNPTPVKIPELGLLVKYGANVKRSEYESQLLISQELRGKVPVPEVFGWGQDGDQGFIYMALVPGQTLEQSWKRMNAAERTAVVGELKAMVNHWRGLRQDSPFVGGIINNRAGPLNDITIKYVPGPFVGRDAVAKFHQNNRIPVLEGNYPIVFTHADLVPCNILLTNGPTPKVAAIIDWGQAGWYPAYWEYCKAVWVNLPTEKYMSRLDEADWKTTYVPRMLTAVDKTKCLTPWWGWADQS